MRFYYLKCLLWAGLKTYNQDYRDMKKFLILQYIHQCQTTPPILLSMIFRHSKYCLKKHKLFSIFYCSKAQFLYGYLIF